MKLSLVVGSAALVVGALGCGDTSGSPSGETGGSATGSGGLGSGGGGAGPSSGGSSGGASGAATGGSISSSGGASSGGALGSGGASATGGTATTGGSSSTGGANASGGTNASGGATNTGGSLATGGKASGGGAGGKASGGGAGGKASGGTTSTGGASTTGGKAGAGGSAGGASCDASWNPPETANGNTGVPAGLAKEWARTGPATLKSKNTKMHQLMENGGQMRYCARWDSSSPISYEERQQAAALMRKCDLQWTDKLTGWGCWPYSTIDVKIVMWVVRDASLLTGWTAAEGSYVVGKTSNDDATDLACPSACNQLPSQPQKTTCTGGQVYDEFLWLDGDKTDYTGWGWSDGFYMSASHFMSAAKSNASTETIVAHELGHAHSLMDFYNANEVPAGWTRFIMKSGSSNVVTETDGWMLRDAWRHIRFNWGYPAAQ